MKPIPSRLPLGLKTKFVLTISFLILATSVILSGFLIKRQSLLIQRELEKRGESMVRNLAHNSEYGVLVENQSLLLNLMEGLHQEEEVVYILIQDKSGRILADWYRSEEFRKRHQRIWLENPSILPVIPSKEYLISNGTEVYNFSYPVKTTRVERSREEVGLLLEGNPDLITRKKDIGVAQIGMSLQNMRREIAEMQKIVVMLTAMVVVMGILLTVFLVNLFIRPVKRLMHATEKIASGDLSHKVEVTTKDEIGTLASSFNRMTVSLKESRQKIEEYNRTLENKVKERTAELENALKSLKETQAQLIQVEKMAAVGQLAAGVAHELNNPLGGILGYSQFALEKINQKGFSQLTREDNAVFLQYLKDIEQQTKRCRSIIQSLLKFSRASRKEEFELTDINTIIKETLVFTKHQILKNKVNLVEEMPDSLPPINGHPGQLQQVFTNLILNSVQSMPQGGTLTVNSRTDKDSKMVEVSFTDTGEGIEKQNLSKIFEPFFTTKNVGEGTGLGLSVSYGLIKNHGGEIKVESKKGEGTTFIVVLPVADKKVTASCRVEEKLAANL